MESFAFKFLILFPAFFPYSHCLFVSHNPHTRLGPLIMTEAIKRRRKRNTIVCLRCRKKKAKCDKNHPCNQCIKAKCPTECTYEKKTSAASSPDQKETKSTSLQIGTPSESSARFSVESNEHPIAEKANPLRIHLEDSQYLVGVNPMVRSTDMINLHMDLSRIGDSTASGSGAQKSWSLPYRGIKVSARPIGFNEPSQQEWGSTLFWRYSYNEERMRNVLAQMLRVRDPNVLKQTADYFGPQYLSASPQDPNVTRAKVSLYGQSMGLLFSINCSENDHFHAILRSIFPQRVVLTTYLEWFFAKVYPFYPIVDEAWINQQVCRLFTYSSSGEMLLLVNSGSRIDFLILGIILLMARLAYLAQLSNIRTMNEVILVSTRIGMNTMSDHAITLSAVDLAFELIHQGSHRRKVSFLYIQASMFKCIYRMVALENEAALYAFDSDCSVSHLVSMAVSLSLERDPDNISNFPGEAKHRNLRRKMWYTLLMMDYQTLFIYHSARCISPDSFNIVLPTFTEEGSNIRDYELERHAIETLRENYEVYRAADELIALNLNLQLNYKVLTVLERLNDLELLIAKTLGTTGSIIENANRNRFSRVLDIAKLRSQVLIRLFMASVYYFLHVYYLYKGDLNLEFFFFRKVMLIIYSELNWLSVELAIKSADYFDSLFTLIMTPIILIYLHVCSMVSLGLLVRLQCNLLTSGSQDKTSIHQQLFDANQAVVMPKLRFCKLLGERCFSAWKFSKTHSFGCQVVNASDMYEDNIELLSKTTLKWSEQQLLDILGALTTESPIQVDDVNFLKQNCYLDCDNIEEKNLTGPDLFKSIQTDNFWILVNSIFEKDLVIFGLSTSINPSLKEAHDIQGINMIGIPARPQQMPNILNEKPLMPNALNQKPQMPPLQVNQVPVHNPPFGSSFPSQEYAAEPTAPMPLHENMQPPLRMTTQSPNPLATPDYSYIPPLMKLRSQNGILINGMSGGARFPSLSGPAGIPLTDDVYNSDIVPDLRDLLDFNVMTTDMSLDDFFACSLNPKQENT